MSILTFLNLFFGALFLPGYICTKDPILGIVAFINIMAVLV